MPFLPRREIERFFSGAAFRRGEELARNRSVLSWKQVDATTLEAVVQGSGPAPYKVTVRMVGKSIDAVCTCPVGLNCKHAVAALLSADPAPGQSRMAAPAAPATTVPPRAPAPAPLPPAISAWIETLLEPGDVARPRNDLVIYVLEPAMAGWKQDRFPRLGLMAHATKRNRTGEISRAGRSFDMTQVDGDRIAHLEPADREIINLAAGHDVLASGYDADLRSGQVAIKGESGQRLLEAAIATGRAFFGDDRVQPVALADPVAADFVWQSGKDGELVPTFVGRDIDLPAGRIVLADRPMLIDARGRRLVPLDTGLPPFVLARLRDAPVIPAAHIEAARAAVRNRPSAFARLDLPGGEAVEQIDGTLRPHLTLGSLTIRVWDNATFTGYGSGHRQKQREVVLGAAMLRFDYPDGFSVPAGKSGHVLTRHLPDRLVELRRDRKAEEAALQRLGKARLLPAAHRDHMTGRHHPDAFVMAGDETGWIGFLNLTVPALEADGWTIERRADFPLRVVEPDGEVAVSVSAPTREAGGIDWFSLDIGVTVDGEAVDLTDLVATLIRARQANGPVPAGPVHLGLPGGRVLALPRATFQPILSALIELVDGSDGLKVDRRGAARLAEAEGVGGVWRGAEALRAMGRVLRDQGGMPAVAVPAGFGAVLRPYQQVGVDWLGFLRTHGFGAVLADDMGLGKTVQTLAMLAAARAAGTLTGPVLVVAPTSVLANWQREAARLTPDLAIVLFHGTARDTEALAGAGLVLTSYGIVPRDLPVLGAVDWAALVLDEAQVLKNPDAATTAAVRLLRAGWRLALSGTPVQNNLSELWSLFSIVNPGLLGDRKQFAATYRTPIEKKNDPVRRTQLQRRVRPFILRRTKDVVATDLPARTLVTETVALGDGQRRLYESIRLAMQDKVRLALAEQGLARSHIVVLDALLKLRQACLDPRLVRTAKAAQAGESAKLDRLMELLATLRDEGRRAVVFSQFTGMMDLIEPRLLAMGLDHVRLDGASTDRGGIIERFQTGDMPVFLASLKAGGVGLNLTSADCVILFDPWWNPAVEDQAIDRVHRIGQTKPVFVYRLVAEATIEEKMDVLKARKRAIAAAIFDADGQVNPALTEADIVDLLG